ncbi:MAG TPA: prephenate dehydratase [Spirochaetota bacterium]|nr:prephenate dehydratase [Spirochaetota bacterium]
MSKKIAFLGPEASFTNEASIKYFGKESTFISINRISDVFDKIVNDEVDFGVTPSENSIGGTIQDTLDLFINSDIKVYDQITLEINQNLMANCEKDNIKKIYSHPQSLLQCANYLNKNFKDVEIIETLSNSKAALIASGENNSASIGPKLCSEVYGLKILETDIQDSKNNQTKFFIISKIMQEELKTKSLILFSVKNKSGSLFNILKIFKKFKINMTKIESRPSKTKNWEYVFIIEYENSSKKELNNKLLKKLEENCDYLDYLGSY